MNWTRHHLDDVGQALWQHIVLVAISIVLALAISLVIGVWTSRRPRAYAAVVGMTALLCTIPSLALFAILIPLLGLGAVPAVAGLVASALLILIRNVATGLRDVPTDIVDAATGMGLSDRQRLFRIELPLALPVIIAGLRIAIVTQIGVGTIAASINAGGLGSLIFAGIDQRHDEMIFVGAALAALLAIVADLTLAFIERRLRAGRAA